MKALAWSLITLAVLTVSFPGILHSGEQTPTGHDVLKDCSLGLDMAQEGYVEDLVRKGNPLPTTAQQNRATRCLSYVVGFKDALYVSQLYQEKNSLVPFVCFPENNINNEEALRIVLRYLQNNSRLLDLPQSALVFNAFYYAFPCKK
ncbi:MAG TPA: Rap1a/Tai family immunity protein [Thermodesulfobacteriota bacterium]|nr:Rap1a/Tai family immunity protein [Thermodesulfobacteriota bacterium]